MFSHRGRSVVPGGHATKPKRAGRPRRGTRPGMLEPLEGRSLLSASPGHGHGHGHGHSPHGGHHAPVADLAAARIPNIVYEDMAGRRELLDVYLPRGTPPPGGWPVLMAIHGGGWRRYSKDDYGP